MNDFDVNVLGSDEPFGEEEESDITQFLFDVGCKFYTRRAGVVCPKDSRKAGQCEKCGWNPTVEKQRKEQIKRRMNDYVH